MSTVLQGLVLTLASLVVLLCPPLSDAGGGMRPVGQRADGGPAGHDTDHPRRPARLGALEQTLDDRLPGGTYEPTVSRMLERFGPYWTSVYWIGWRNRAHGLRRVLGRPSTEAAYLVRFPPGARGVRPDGSWYWERAFGPLRVVAGHRVYRIAPGDYLAVPTLTVKRRS